MMHGMLCHYVFTVLCDLTETLRSATAAVRAFESATPETRVSDAEASRYPNPGPRCNPVITPLAAMTLLVELALNPRLQVYFPVICYKHHPIPT